jgi:hypothetical protein
MHRRRTVASLLMASVAIISWPTTASACSPVFDPTIAALGPRQVVVLGTVGERVLGGRLFHVERWYNGGEPITPIVIAFQEGEPVGDCSYPVQTGERKIIAPEMEAGGRLSANFATLQGDPATDGRRWVEEATALFGPGVVPRPVDNVGEPLPSPETGGSSPVLLAGIVLVLLALLIAGVVRWRRF